ncbi:hypothetical protein [endosymbiont GvMRE of Glomus versiforme]|uniref:hypothetical protein n=1 Tax=endosymbiont GvMRE of Glomus versiforme TaxID=2039283 RepID=UPI000EBF3E46|nr:hypothetical protein [endosymbiont GvMRE of Glomus versiforme]RHZ35460.1 50S ribosomal protein L7/L12 [endosymbiont GvMRE of Glomus versiforme]
MSEIKNSNEVSTIKENIKKLNLGQISELIDGLKKDLNIEEQALVQPIAATKTEEKVEEKGNVSVKWVKMKDEKATMTPILEDIVIAVKELEEKNITKFEAMKLAKKGIVLENIPWDKAEEFKNKMEKKGAEFEIIK